MLSVILTPVLAAVMVVDPRLEQLNSPENEIAIAFSADGTEAWLERRGGPWGRSDEPRRLYHFTRETAKADWSGPLALPFDGTGADYGDPFFDDRTQTLYFTTDRPSPEKAYGATDIWRMQRRNGRWLQPEPLPTGINSPGREYSPVRRGERLYFVSDRDGHGDIYMATQVDGEWSVRRLGAAVNSPWGEWNVWVSPDENLMLFEASGRPGNLSPAGDLYASRRDAGGRWLPAVALESLNGAGSELNARIVGGQLVYASTSRHPAQADLYATHLDPEIVVKEAYRQRLHVVNRSSHELVSIELADGVIGRRLEIGPGPHLVAAGAPGLATAAYGIYPRPHGEPVAEMPGWVNEEGGHLLVVDAAGHTRRFRLECRHPHGTAWDGDSARLWVTCEDRSGVIELDLGEEPPARRFVATGREGAHVVAAVPHRGWLLVAHTAAGGVTIVRPDGEPMEFVASGRGSEALWIDRVRDRAWVTLGPSDAVAVFGLGATEEITRLDPACGFPIDFARTSDGNLWIACFGSSEIVAIDPETPAVIDRMALPAGPLNIEGHPSLPTLYASLPRRNEVIEISLIGRGVTRAFRTGVEPDGLTFPAPYPDRSSKREAANRSAP